MKHVLDNPVWSALTTGNSNLAIGNELVKYLDLMVSPFVGLKENNANGLTTLVEVLPNKRPAIVIMSAETEIPKEWKLLHYIPCYQMVYDTALQTPQITANARLLTTGDIPQMMDLTKLTNPGPFSERTIEFGHYYGLFDEDKLIAMAGQRIHASPYAEISAVCTHPDYLGRGYAKQLLLHQIHRIMAAGEFPYLHVRDDNERAKKVYESIGFKIRTVLHFYVLMKDSDRK